MRKLGQFDICVFKHTVFVFQGLPDGLSNRVQAHCEYEPGQQYINIYVKDKNAFQGYVMHECVHAADFILNNIGADMGCNPSDSEIRAYLAEYIFCKTECVLGNMKETSLFGATTKKQKANNANVAENCECAKNAHD